MNSRIWVSPELFHAGKACIVVSLFLMGGIVGALVAPASARGNQDVAFEASQQPDLDNSASPLRSSEPLAEEQTEKSEILQKNDQAPLNGPASDTSSSQEIGQTLETYKNKLAWNLGAWRIEPTGWLEGDVVCASDEVTGRLTVVYVEQQSSYGKLPQCSVSGQSSDLGFNFFGPEIWGLKAKGNIEFNLMGDHPLWDQSTPFLIGAYGELRNDNGRFLFGQYSGLVNPLNPTMINFGAGIYTGNIYGYRGQLRLERYFHVSENVQYTLQTAISQEFVNDFTPTRDTDDESSDNGLPNIEGRANIALGRKIEGSDARILQLGVSGFGGQARLLYKGVKYTPIESMFGCDVRLANERFGFQGEFFYGRGLSSIGGGIGQSINTLTGRAICDAGGWGEIWTKFGSSVTVAMGYGIDHPSTSDLEPSTVATRARNDVYYTTVFWDVTKQLRFGLEVDYRKTTYLLPMPTDLPGMRLYGDNSATVCWFQTRLTY